ncbi:MAG: creatininase family protein [Gemmatimonadales bacterium]|nr:creatininase family protein [Gemmatimonadales bacterium]
MTPARAEEVLTAVPRLLLPAGTLTVRGPHLPLGCDTVILERLADDLSIRTGIACAPALDFGVSSAPEGPGPGTASLTRKTLHRAVNELIAVWEDVAAIRDTLILTAHAADQHLEALSTIRTLGRVRVADIFALEELGPLRQSPPGRWHGGEVDTSLVMYIAPDLVDQARIPPGLSASPELGERFYSAILNALSSRLGN